MPRNSTLGMWQLAHFFVLTGQAAAFRLSVFASVRFDR
jgi:hypothetical protein